MTFACDFDATPRGVVSGKTVRFYPRVSGNLSPITNYNWDFGDGSSPVDEPTPIHTYPVVTEYTTYDVILTVTDSDSNEATHTNEDFITSDIDANVTIPDFTINVIAFIWDDNYSMMVERQAGACSLYLLSPKINDMLDKIGTASFSLISIGDSTADELSLIKEGSSVAFSSNQGLNFQGVIRRATQDLQGAFSQTTRVKKWNIECDSDLARHKKMPVLASQLMASGAPVIDSPGYIARRILTPAGGAQDIRGVIDCIDPKIAYRLNSADKEEVGSQYEHLMTLRDATNYDLRVRPYGTVSEAQTLGWGYQPFNGNFELGEFFGDYDYGWGECGELEGPGRNCSSWSPWGNTVTPIAAKPGTGTYGARMRVKINDYDPDDDWLGYYIGSWNNIYNFTNAPAGFTSISFDYKIVKYSHTPTYTDIEHRWGGECAEGESAVVFWLEDGSGNDLWVEDTGEVGDWIHVNIPMTNPGANFEVDFYLTTEFNVPCNQGQIYDYDYYIDNVRYHYTDDVAAGVWAYIKLEENVLPYLYYPVACQLSNGHIIFGGGIGIWYSPNYWIYRSTDNGMSWSQRVYNEDVCPNQMFAMGDRAFACVGLDSPYTRHALYMSVDEGLTWTWQSNCETDQWASYWVMGTTIHRLAQYVYSKSEDYGVTWTINAPTPTGFDYTSDPAQIMVMADGTIVLFSYLYMYHSHDNGANWTTVACPNLAGIDGGYQGYYVMEYPAGTILSFGNESGSVSGTHIVTTTDYGATWTEGTDLVAYRVNYNTPFEAKTNGTIIMQGMHYYLAEPCWYHSTDWGQSYTLINGIPPSSLIGDTYYFGALGIVEVVEDNNADTVVFYDADPDVRYSSGDSVANPSGYVLDFAPDVSQPHAVKNLDVNSTCFGFNDNDGKENLSTQIVVRGKDYSGKSISVQVAGVHAYDEDRKFFNDSTYINQKSEGYIYKNSYATDLIKDCDGILGSTVTYSVDYVVDHYGLHVGATGFVVGNLVSFTNPPAPLVHNQAYYIVDHTAHYIKVSSTLGGSPIHLNHQTVDYAITWGYSSCPVSGTAYAKIKGENISVALLNSDDDDAVVAKVAAACNGYVDADGITWSAVVVGAPYARVEFTSHYEGLGDTPIGWDDNGTFCTAGFESSRWVAWTVTLEASDISIMQVDNSDGWFTLGMNILFAATIMPTGLDATTIYTIGSTPAVSATATFVVKSGGTIVKFTTTGTDVKCYKPNTVKNLDENGMPCVWLYDWGYAIQDTDDLAVSIPGETATALTASGTPIETVDVNGVMCTTVSINGTPLIDYGGGKGFLLNKKLYVEDASFVGNNEVMIGEEKATISSNGVDIAYGPYIVLSTVTGRVSSASNKCYPHGLGALVARTNYTTSAPETGSPIELHGIHVLDETVDSNVTYGDLDAYATFMLLGLGNFWKKGICWLPLTNSLVNRIAEYPATESIATPITVGDHISITEYSGATPEDWQVVGVETLYDEGRMKLELGDFEKNIFTSLERKTNALNRTVT